MKNRISDFWLPALAAILMNTLTSPCLAAAPEPGRLEVQVVDRQNGAPVADAAVCLGTSARLDQFGARRSDSKGVVRFGEVSPHPLVLTVSGEGYQGRRQALEPVYENRVLVVKLVTGGGGPVCQAPSRASATGSGSALVVTSVQIKNDVNAAPSGVLVAARVTGSANQIRISEQADFGDVEWRPYEPTLTYTLSEGQGAKQLYVQVRRAAEVQGASLEVLSPIKKVSYRRQ
jgi:hypothetical protein